jgi:HEPN domain-containing protein
MPSPEQLAAVAMEWMLKSEEDLQAATHLLKMGKECPTATIAFHAQQCVEKHLKALLVVRSIEFPKTHDIEKLVGLLPLDVVISLPVTEQRSLSIYGTVTRYPGDYEPVSVQDARKAVSMARRVRRDLRHLLPKGMRTRK